MGHYVQKSIDRATWNMLEERLGHRPYCDFCGSRHPVYVYAASRMSNGTYQNCWRWTACILCEDSICREDWGHISMDMLLSLRTILPKDPVILLQRMVDLSLNEFFLYSIKERPG
jgi:hypothetical protein